MSHWTELTGNPVEQHKRPSDQQISYGLFIWPACGQRRCLFFHIKQTKWKGTKRQLSPWKRDRNKQSFGVNEVLSFITQMIYDCLESATNVCSMIYIVKFWIFLYTFLEDLFYTCSFIDFCIFLKTATTSFFECGPKISQLNEENSKCIHKFLWEVSEAHITVLDFTQQQQRINKE